jgi:hypothetical protein
MQAFLIDFVITTALEAAGPEMIIPSVAELPAALGIDPTAAAAADDAAL